MASPLPGEGTAVLPQPRPSIQGVARRRKRRRRRRTLIRVVVASVALVCGTGLVRLWVVPGPDRLVLGAYAGYTDTVGLAAFSRTVGFRVDKAMDFLDGTSWRTIDLSPAHEVPIWDRTGYRMTWGIPILPNSGASLQVGATGAYDAHFETIARYLVAHGQASSVIRLGWEFNGDWFSWSAAGCPACFVSYWRHIVTTMRAVPGEQFLFEWNPAAGTGALAPPAAYPGNRFVDIIGLDVYDNVPGIVRPAARWNHLLFEPFGLAWVVGFAESHGKALSFPEWGLGWPPEGGGDNAYFVTHMARFILSLPNVDNANFWDYGTSLSAAPRAQAALSRAFG